MTDNNNSLAVRENSNAGAISPFSSKSAFADAQEMLAPLMDSTMVPECYRAYTLDKNKQWVENPAALENCLMAMEIATRAQQDSHAPWYRARSPQKRNTGRER